MGNAMNIDLIEVAEDVATKMDILCSRTDNAITLQLKNGKFILSVAVDSEHDIMVLICDLKLQVPKNRQSTILKAIAQVNERIWVGHFDFVTTRGCIVYSLTIPFLSSFVLERRLVASMYQNIADECDKFYNYFFTLINEKSQKKDSVALQALFINTCAEA